MKKRFSEEQIIGFLREADAGKGHLVISDFKMMKSATFWIPT